MLILDSPGWEGEGARTAGARPRGPRLRWRPRKTTRKPSPGPPRNHPVRLVRWWLVRLAVAEKSIAVQVARSGGSGRVLACGFSSLSLSLSSCLRLLIIYLSLLLL